MERRLLGRNEGRTDDNIETIRKRFKVCVCACVCVFGERERAWVRGRVCVWRVRERRTPRAAGALVPSTHARAHPRPHPHPHPPTHAQVFLESSLPVVQHYEALGKVARINADRDPEDIYKEVRRLFVEL